MNEQAEPLEPVDALDAAPQEEDFDWERFLAEQFHPDEEEQQQEQPEQPPVEGEEGQSSPEQEEPEGEAPPPPAQPQPQLYTLGDRQLTKEQAESLVGLYDFIQQHPNEALAFMDVLEGRAQVVRGEAQSPSPSEASSPQFSPPAEEDWEFVPQSLRERMAKLDEMEQRFAAHEDFLRRQQEQQALAYAQQAAVAVEKGVEQFRSRYDVTDEDLEKIRNEAARLQLADRLLAEVGDPVRAVDEALEIALLRNPEFREREIARKQQEQLLADEKRQRKLSAIAGSSGSAPRDSKPSTREDINASMVDMVRAAMRGE